MTSDLFSDQIESQVKLAAGAYWLRGFVLPEAYALCAMLIAHFNNHAPQQMMTPMGYHMSVRTTSVGTFGWVSTKQGYGYAAKNSLTNQHWPVMPELFLTLAQRAAKQAGYINFKPDTCLINVYEIGDKMGLHQDKNEADFSQPIVSVSLGLPATFQFGGLTRAAKALKVPLSHGDVVVWGAESRLYYHGVLPLKSGAHPLLGHRRINLTFRKAGKM
jgi:alkylated DNA repair protein (DNA oxidative demethylase)